MKKIWIALLSLIVLLATITPVFAINGFSGRMIDFISQRNRVAVSDPPETDTGSVQPAPSPDPAYDWTTPFMAYVEIKASGGTVNWLNDLDIDSVNGGYPKLKLKLFTYQGNIKLYGMSALYVRGTLVGGDTFFASIWIPDQDVEMMSFTENDIWFNATKPSRAFIYNYNTRERRYQYLDTVRCHITGGLGGNVDCAAGYGGEMSNYTYISGMTVTTFDYRTW